MLGFIIAFLLLFCQKSNVYAVLTNLAVRQNANAPPRDSCREQIRANERTKKEKTRTPSFLFVARFRARHFFKMSVGRSRIVRQKKPTSKGLLFIPHSPKILSALDLFSPSDMRHQNTNVKYLICFQSSIKTNSYQYHKQPHFLR